MQNFIVSSSTLFMDLHPLIVHFPIALLTVYSALEVLRAWTKQPFWKPLRAFLVMVGTIGAFAALQTGEVAEHLFQDSSFRNVLELHSLMANITTFLFAVLGGAYVVELLQEKHVFEKLPRWCTGIVNMILTVKHIVHMTPVVQVLALLGFLCLSLVGALGAILVYGPEFDPMTSLVYSLFFGS